MNFDSEMLLEGFLVLIKHCDNVSTSVFREVHAGFEILLLVILVENASPNLNVCAQIVMVIVGDNDLFVVLVIATL